MNTKYTKYSGYLVSLFGILVLYLSFDNGSFSLMMIGIFLVLIGVLLVVLFSSLELFKNDKLIDYENVEKMNLTLCTCNNCDRENVLEDLFCRYCGETLEVDTDEI